MGRKGAEPCSELKREPGICLGCPSDTALTGGYITWTTSACQTPTVNRWNTKHQGGHKGEGPVMRSGLRMSIASQRYGTRRALVRVRGVRWLLDNSASLHSLTKETSGNIHLLKEPVFYMISVSLGNARASSLWENHCGLG